MYRNRMREIRNRKNITLKELSEATGVSVGYLCHLEKGSRRNPSMQTMQAIAEGLKERIEYVFFD